MYRAYEDPRKLQKQLDDELERLEMQKLEGYEPDEFDYERIENLRERINFAWQDEEYDEDCARYDKYGYPNDMYEGRYDDSEYPRYDNFEYPND